MKYVNFVWYQGNTNAYFLSKISENFSGLSWLHSIRTFSKLVSSFTSSDSFPKFVLVRFFLTGVKASFKMQEIKIVSIILKWADYIEETCVLQYIVCHMQNIKLIMHLANRFHVDVHLLNNRSLMLSKSGKKKKVANEVQLIETLMFLQHSDFFCNPLLFGYMAMHYWMYLIYMVTSSICQSSKRS